MIGLDTNVIVRYLAQDDPRQAAAATRLIEGSLTAETRGFVSIVTLVEVVWVISSNYRGARAAVAEILEGLLTAPQRRLRGQTSSGGRCGRFATLRRISVMR